ncbi:MAG: hypothetical protein H7Y06_06255 [Opitutaceae bacterium]|nr:hypothetical protein [Opitutaceae bacterium]
MIRRLTLLAPVFLFAATLLPAAPKVPLVNLVDDQTFFAISVTDTPALLRGWDASPIAATWNDPQVAKFLAPTREQLKIDEWDDESKAATGLTVRELLALAEGEALIALPAFAFSRIEQDAPPPVLMALEVGGQGAKIEKILADSAVKNESKEESEMFSGVKVTVHTVKEKKSAASTPADDVPAGANAPAPDVEDAAPPSIVAWAIVDGAWLMSNEKECLFAAINALQQGGHATGLGKSERFLRTRQRIGDAQALVYVNLPAIYPLIKEGVAAAKAAAGAKPNVLGIDPEAVFDALGLDALGESYVALAMSETSTRLDFGLAYTEERGLLKLIAYQPGPTSQPDWVPAKWPSVSSVKFSLPKAYAGLEEIVEAVSPMLSGMAQGQIRAFNKKLGIDLVRDFIGSFGDDLVTAYSLPPGLEPGTVPPWTEMDQLVSISLVNEPALIKSLDALKQLAGPAAAQMFTEREYLGQKLYTLNVPSGEGPKQARGFSYAIANRTLLVGIGSAATVESALQGMAAPKDVYWQRADVKAALADLPADAVALQVQDLGLMMQSLVETAVQLQQQATANGTEGGEAKTYVDVDARPDNDVMTRYWGLAAGHAVRTPEGLFSTTRIAHPQK